MARITPTDSPNILIDQVTDWLMGEALSEPNIEHLVEGTAARVDAAGIPILRFHISFNMLHPLYSGMGLTWRRGQKLEVARFERSDAPENREFAYQPSKRGERRGPVVSTTS